VEFKPEQLGFIDLMVFCMEGAAIEILMSEKCEKKWYPVIPGTKRPIQYYLLAINTHHIFLQGNNCHLRTVDSLGYA
jgi:hypothetical protein